MGAEIPLSLYVHFPWCVKKCPYCDFNSHEVKDQLPEEAYVDALLDDLSNYDLDRPIQSIFLGGGTPSLFSPSAITRFFDGLNAQATLTETVEVTMEANPGTTDYEKFSGYRSAGVNRLSLGVQSFTPEHLISLGRIHSSEEVDLAFLAARSAGFDNINLDLMHGLPEQRLQNALTDLDKAISLEPEHISWYQLTIEPNTVFYKQPPKLPTDDTLWTIYENGLEKLHESGYERYEVSAFSIHGKQSVHNLNYWRFGDYIGIGAGAHGKLSQAGTIHRTSKTRLPKDYLQHQRETRTPVEEDQLTLEFLMNALRLTTGFTTNLFEDRTGQSKQKLESFLAEGTSRQLLLVSNGQVRPTSKGIQFLNELLMLVD